MGAACNITESGNIILLDKSNATRKYIDEYIAAHNIHFNRILEVTSMDLLIEFAKIGMGVGCVIKEFVSEELDKNILTQVRLKAEIPPRTIGFAFLHSNPNPMLKAFIQ